MAEKNSITLSTDYTLFRDEITTRIRSAQYEALKAVNKEMIALYWEIGKRITEQQAALGWGESVVETLSGDIQKEFPGIQGFGVRNMWDMARFYAEYQSDEILQPLVAEISWSKHIVSVSPKIGQKVNGLREGAQRGRHLQPLFRIAGSL